MGIKIIKKFSGCILVSTFILASCGGDDDEVCKSTYVNSAPVIASNGDEYIYMQENQTVAFTVNATDDDGDTLSYNLNGDDDGGLFVASDQNVLGIGFAIGVDDSGVVNFTEAPDYENPVDTDGDGIYRISVIVEDDNECSRNGVLSTTKKFAIKVTNDPADDEGWSWWFGNLIINNDYAPYDKHLTSYGLIVAGLPDVTNDFMDKVGNIVNIILRRNTNNTDRNLLLGNIIYYQALQRVGATGMSSYDPPLDETNYPGWDNFNDSYQVDDFIWEATQNSSEDEKTNAAQISAILKPLLHTITLIYEKTFAAWDYEGSSSQLVLAMNEAINGGYYDPTGNYGDLPETDPTAYKRVIAQDFAYWMILTGWDLKSAYAPDTSPEWTIQNSKEMETNTPLAYALYIDYVRGILANPSRYLASITFESIQTTSD